MLGLGLTLTGLALMGRTEIQKAISVLRKFGTNAHVYLPGVGMLNGLQAGNYIDSAGTQAGVVDQPVGLDLDAMGVLGVELHGTVGYTQLAGTAWSQVGQTMHCDGTVGQAGSICLVVGKTYKFTFTSPTAVNVYLGGSTYLLGQVGTVSWVGVATGNASIMFQNTSSVAAFDVTNISVREISGIHASQTTTGSKPILRRGAVNLALDGGNLSGWSTTAAGVITGGQADPLGGTSAQLFSGAGKNVYRPLVIPAGLVTFAFTLYSPTAGTITLGGASGPGVIDLVPVSAGWGTYAVTKTIPANDGCAVILDRSLTSITFHRAALFQGTYTAAQIQALGGIPLTTTAPASTALGPYWWDTAGGKTLVATFPAGNESCTVIDAAKTGQVTTTAQNVVGAYNINTPTSGRFVINGAITSPELALIQSLANKLAGL